MQRPLYNPDKGVMKVAGMMSSVSTGSNLEAALKRQGKYKFVVIFTDRRNPHAEALGERYGVPVMNGNFNDFCDKFRVYGDEAKQKYDGWIADDFLRRRVQVIACAGYMRIITPELIQHFSPRKNTSRFMINLHPSDGNPSYAGAHAVKYAMNNSEQYIRSHTHILTERLDAGPMLVVSDALAVNYSLTPEQNQERLKELEHRIFPMTLELLAEGRFTTYSGDALCFDGKRIPDGLRQEELEIQKIL